MHEEILKGVKIATAYLVGLLVHSNLNTANNSVKPALSVHYIESFTILNVICLVNP